MTETVIWDPLVDEACGRSILGQFWVLKSVKQVLNSVKQGLNSVKQVLNSVKT